MEQLEKIITIVSTLAGFLLTCLIPTIIVMINRIKAVRKKRYNRTYERLLC